MRRTSKALILVASMLLLSVGAVIAEESFVHTDDGCAVEVHCLACRLTLGATGVLVHGLAAPAAMEVVGLVTDGRPFAIRDRTPRVDRSRAPPLV